MSIKSRTCMGAVSKTPLTEYATEDEARAGAACALTRYGRQLEPYRCDRCRRWHLTPADRQTPSSTCSSCIGRDGRPKARYESQAIAERRAEILLREQALPLRVYPCPYGGWHLTKG